MTLGELLSQAVEWFAGWWPFRIVQEWEQGVRLLNGKIRATLTHENGIRGTGVHWFVPGLGEIFTRDANIEVLETDLQTVHVGDAAVTFSLGVKWRIRDLGALYSKVHDPDSTVAEAIRSAAGRAFASFETAGEARMSLADAVARDAKRVMYGWGVELIEVSAINFTTAQALRLIVDSGAASAASED